MIFVLQGRLTVAPKPPATKPVRRNFMVAVDAADVSKAADLANDHLEGAGYSFISMTRVFQWNKQTGDKALDAIIDHASRHGAAHALYR